MTINNVDPLRRLAEHTDLYDLCSNARTLNYYSLRLQGVVFLPISASPYPASVESASYVVAMLACVVPPVVHSARASLALALPFAAASP
jgi:hypothetical protein